MPLRFWQRRAGVERCKIVALSLSSSCKVCTVDPQKMIDRRLTEPASTYDSMRPMFHEPLALALGVAVLLTSPRAWAGPPYVTDDPEPVEYRHWEIYLASQSFRDGAGWSGTAPHVEVNFGAIPDVQLHVIAPLAFSAPDHGRATYGYGDTELGFKLRFLHEQKYVPMIGIFPLVEVPTGDRAADLGNGSAVVFVPVWLQKTFGAWTMYGGVGVWIDLGDRDRHWWLFGWHLERRVSSFLALGVELFDQTPSERGASNDARFNVGAVIDLSDTHHLLLSVGRGFFGSNQFQGYLAYQLTFAGPGAPR